MFQWFEQLLNPYPDRQPVKPIDGFFNFIGLCIQGLRGPIIALFLGTILIGAFEAILFSFLGEIIDWLGEVEPARFWEEKGGQLLVFFALLVMSIGVVAFNSMIEHQTLAGNFPMLLRWHFHRSLLGQSIKFYQDEFAGRLSTKVMQTALAVRDAVLTVSSILVFVAVYFITMMVVVSTFTWLLLVIFVVWLALFTWSLYFFVPRLARTGMRQADARALMTGRITDAYTNIHTVKLFSHTKRETSFARSAMQDFMTTVYAQMRLVTIFEIVNYALGVFLILGTTGLTLWLWSQEQTSVGIVAAASAMAMRMNGMSHWVMWEMTSLFENIGIIQDGIKTLTQPVVINDQPDAPPLKVTTGKISFEHVYFSYGTTSTIIEDLLLTIQPGEKIGLVGRSGAGKSTIVNLLLRFYDVESGRILIDGQNIAEVTQHSLRAQIGMVTQDTSLLHRSVRDNLLYGRPDASEDEMIRAAMSAKAYDFVKELVDHQGHKGFDAHVGERGVKLSGGQRQRIAIARVILKNAPILLLDEATSALDSEVEVAIQESLSELMRGKTVVAIAHRLSTIAMMDRLIVLERGKIVEEGNHHTLLSRNGLYAKLWRHQSGGFLGQDG